MLELRVETLEGTRALAAGLAGLARRGDLIVLSGEMGAGKTAFAQGFGAALGVSDPITSPTFTLVHSYDLPAGGAAKQLHHADLYRLDRTAEVADLALEELADGDGIVLVEWGDVVEAMFGDHLAVHLDLDPEIDSDLDPEIVEAGTVRLIEISAVGSTWAGRWSRVVEVCEAAAC